MFDDNWMNLLLFYSIRWGKKTEPQIEARNQFHR